MAFNLGVKGVKRGWIGRKGVEKGGKDGKGWKGMERGWKGVERERKGVVYKGKGKIRRLKEGVNNNLEKVSWREWVSDRATS